MTLHALIIDETLIDIDHDQMCNETIFSERETLEPSLTKMANLPEMNMVMKTLCDIAGYQVAQNFRREVLATNMA